MMVRNQLEIIDSDVVDIFVRDAIIKLKDGLR
jgi:hypothetical protein